MIETLIDLDTLEMGPWSVTPEQAKLVEELLDTDCGWDSAIVRITRVNPTTVEFTRVETYKRGEATSGKQELA